MSTFRTIGGWLTLLTALAVALTGCVPSDEPLSGEEDSQVDERILGKWRLGDKPKDVVEIRRHETLRNALVIDASQPIYPVEINGQRYLSVGPAEGDKRSFEIVHYVLSPDETKLTAVLLDEKKIAAAIAKGELRGEVVERKGFFGFRDTRVRLTDSTANLREYVAKHGEACFEPLKKADFVLRRVAAEK